MKALLKCGDVNPDSMDRYIAPSPHRFFSCLLLSILREYTGRSELHRVPVYDSGFFFCLRLPPLTFSLVSFHTVLSKSGG